MTREAVFAALTSFAGDGADVDAAWARLSDRYRSAGATPIDLTERDVAAYALGRALATTAAVGSALDAVVDRRPRWAPTSLLDVGAGLGTASLIAADQLPTIERVDLVERAPAMVEGGSALEAGLRSTAQRAWHRRGADDLGGLRSDVVLASYVLSELGDAEVDGSVAAWWAATADVLLVVDTGTPAGFRRLVAARTQLLDDGANIIAPCPNHDPCPMTRDDWCHFSVRLPRPPALRRLKAAELGHEDEKFCYLAVAKVPVEATAGRVVRHPQSRNGHVRLQVCHDGQVEQVVIPRSRRDAYRWARDVRWGDGVPPEVLTPPG